ncbi:MAG: class E sortase [Acidimicrobiales bacterium]|nr:class E sortase [Acidimicrobiales bacterium]
MVRWLGRFGRLLIGAGLLMLLFVGYQLWGTGLVEARAQGDLVEEFERFVDTPRVESVDAPGPPDSRAESTPAKNGGPTWPVSLDEGSALARLRIPSIDVDKVVVEGVGRGDLRRGPGHYPGTVLPGQAGNSAIAGHRTTYGAPFFRLDELDPGDEVLIDTPAGEVRYVVSNSEIVAPTQVDVLEDVGDNRLTLTTCNPRYSAAERLIVTAILDPTEEPASAVVTTATSESAAPSLERQTLDESPEGRPGRLPVVLWGFATVLVGAAIWFLGRRWRRWPSYLLGSPVFLIVLFVFFEHLNRLLPPSV